MCALFGFLLLAALFYAPILIGLRTFPEGDFTQHFLPFSLFQRSEMLAGRLPLWNPYTYAGHPFLADVQAAVYYPVSNLVLGLSLPWAEAGARLWWLEVEAALHLALAGFFTYLLAASLTERRGAAFLAGVTFAFSGYLTGYPPLQLAVLRTAVWLPLVLWLLWRGFEEPERWRWWVGAGMACAVAFLAGHSQTFLFVGYAVAGWWALLAATRRGGQTWGAVARHLAVFATVFLGLSMAQLLPSLEFTRLSVRAAGDYAFLSGGFPVQDTWQMLLPRVLTVFSPLYVGVVALGLALVGATATALAPEGLRYRAGGFYFGVLAALALLVSYGGNGYLYPLLYRFAPGWRLFRGQERAAYLVAFGLSLLAAYGVAALNAMPVGRRRRWVGAYAVAAALGIGVFYWFWQRAGRTAVSSQEFAVLALSALALLAAFVGVVSLERPARWREGALIVLVAADLFLANSATNLDAGSPAQKVAPRPEAAVLAAAVREEGGPLGLPRRTYNEYRVPEDWGMTAGVEDVWGSSPLRLARYAALFDEFPLDRMWRLAGVGHVLTWRRELPTGATGALLGEWPQATDTTYLHRLAESNPRAWVTDQVRYATDAEAVRLLADGGTDLERVAIVPPPGDEHGGGAALPGDGPLAAPGASTVQVAQAAPGRLRINVDSHARWAAGRERKLDAGLAGHGARSRRNHATAARDAGGPCVPGNPDRAGPH